MEDAGSSSVDSGQIEDVVWKYLVGLHAIAGGDKKKTPAAVGGVSPLHCFLFLCQFPHPQLFSYFVSLHTSNWSLGEEYDKTESA